MKILVVADVVILVALIVILMTLKGGYEEQAKRTANEQESAYLEKNTQVLVEQWRSVDQYSMAWKLVYTVLSGAKTEAAFNSSLAAIQADKDARFKQLSYMYTAAGIPAKVQNDINEKGGLADKFLLKNEGGVKEVACGKNCTLSFTFAKGKLANSDYKALVEYNMDEAFKLEAPAEFHFE